MPALRDIPRTADPSPYISAPESPRQNACGGADQRDYPHPEDRACAAGGYGRNHSDQISHSHTQAVETIRACTPEMPSLSVFLLFSSVTLIISGNSRNGRNLVLIVK